MEFYSKKYNKKNNLTELLLHPCCLCEISLNYDKIFYMDCGHPVHIKCFTYIFNNVKKYHKYCSMCYK